MVLLLQAYACPRKSQQFDRARWLSPSAKTAVDAATPQQTHPAVGKQCSTPSNSMALFHL